MGDPTGLSIFMTNVMTEYTDHRFSRNSLQISFTPRHKTVLSHFCLHSDNLADKLLQNKCHPMFICNLENTSSQTFMMCFTGYHYVSRYYTVS